MKIAASVDLGTEDIGAGVVEVFAGAVDNIAALFSAVSQAVASFAGVKAASSTDIGITRWVPTSMTQRAQNGLDDATADHDVRGLSD